VHSVLLDQIESDVGKEAVSGQTGSAEGADHRVAAGWILLASLGDEGTVRRWDAA
jgi:hypothetical protein